MSLVPNEDGLKINWVNYKTGIKHLYVRMEADHKTAKIYVAISHPDEGIRELMFTQFKEYKNVLHAELGEEWIWSENHYDEYGKNTTRIGIELDKNVSVFKAEDWPTLINFFKPRIIALDQFWSNAKYGFELFK